MRLIKVVSAALLLSFEATATEDIMAICYGNTVVGTSEMGESRTHYKPDHTFDSTLSSARGSMQTQGTWALNDKGEICKTFNPAVPRMPNPLCTPWAAHRLGDKWQVEANGHTAEVMLISGIQ